MRKTVLLTLAFVVLVASPATAALNEYYTYGGYTPVTMAFENLARIFGDSAYKGAIGTFMLLGLALGVSSGYVKMAAGQGGPIAWVAPFLIGLILYMGFFVPKMNLAIYDPVYNQNKVIAGVPSGVVVVSSIVNRLERFVVETFDTNAALPPNTACGPMSPMQYQQFGGAIGMRLMRSSADQYVQSSDASQTLNSYINDCVVFELNRPGTTLTIDKLLTPGCGKTMLDVMGEANNPANFTTSYFGSSTGTTETCAVVYDKLTTYYSNPLNSNQPGANACAGTGFTDSARCQELLVTMLNASTGDSFDGSKFISNNTVAGITRDALLTGGGAATTAYLTQINQAQSGSSSGFMAGIMNPYMIDAYVAYTLMLLPVLALFLVTPLWKNAFGLIISMIVWTCLLRCLDVITFHSWAAQYQMAAAAALKSSGMGLDAAMRLPVMSNQYLGTFASMRNSVFLLATAVSGALFKFGDSAMSRLADKATADHDGVKGAISDRGTAAKMAMDSAAGAQRASMMTALASGAHGWDNVGKGMAANEFSSAAAGAGALSAFGGNVNSMMSGQGHTAMVNTVQSSARAGGISEAQARGMGVNDAASQKAVLDRMGTDGKLASWSAGLATDKNLGESKGFQAAHEAAKASGYTGSIQDFQKDMSKVLGEKGFADSQGWQSFVKDKFAGNESGAIQAATNVAAYQLGKHSGEVDRTMAGTGKGATAAGNAVGTTVGDANLMSMASDNVRRGIAEENAGQNIKNNPNLYRQAGYTEAGKAKLAEQAAAHQAERTALKDSVNGMQLTPNDKAKYLQQKNAEIDKKQAVERQGLKEKLEHDPQMHQKAGLTEAGYAAFMNQIAGTNQQGFSDKTAYGNVDKRVLKDGQGNTIMTQEKGAVHDKKEMGALAKELKAAGFKNTAQEIESMAAQGKGFNFDMTRDKTGHITGFNATGGATASLNDKAREDMGRLKEYTNLDKSTVGSISWKGKSKIEEDTDKKLIDKGLRETIGNRSSRGDRLDHFDQKQVATPSGMENGYYYKAKNGTEFLVSGQKDGLLHQKMQKDGKAVDIMIDPRTGAVLLEKGESGKKEVIFADRTEYQGGSAVTGSFNSAVSKAVSKATGWDEKSVQLGVGTFEDLTSSVLPLANAGSGGAGVKGRLNETKDVLQKGKATGQKVLDKMTRANKSIRVDEAGRVVTRKGTGSAPAPAAGGAPAPSAGGVPRGDIGGGLTNTSGSPSPSPSGYSGLPGGGNQAPRTAPRPAARPAGNSNLGGINNTHPAAPNNGGYGKVGTGNVKSPKPAGAGAPKKTLHPAKIM